MTAFDRDLSPDPVRELARACESFVHKALNVPLDYTQDTLPLLDHYLQLAKAGATELHTLVGAAAGAYFGEVIREHFGRSSTRWANVQTIEQTDGWRIEFSQVFLWFNPVLFAREALAEQDLTEGGTGFQLLAAEQSVLSAALSSLGAVESVEYYSLSTRFDVLCSVVDRLTILRQRALKTTDSLPTIDAVTYRATIDGVDN
jgi:hypothetical protein